MKILFEFFPIVLFFVAYQFKGIYWATGVLIASVVAQTLYYVVAKKPMTKMQITSTVLIVVFGGVTLLLENDYLIKIKVTAVNWLFGLVFLGSHFIGKQTIIQRVLGSQLPLPAQVLRKLNVYWVAFFFFSGAVNLYVLQNFSEETWVNFKLFGMLGLTLVFMVVQILVLKPHLKDLNDHVEKQSNGGSAGADGQDAKTGASPDSDQRPQSP